MDTFMQWQQELTFLSIDVIEEVDGIFDDAIARVAIVATRRRARVVLVDHNALAKLGVEVNLLEEHIAFQLFAYPKTLKG